MENLNLDKFSPTVAALQDVAKKYQGLVISGVADKDGYLAVNEARKELKTQRVEISKTGKMLRADAITFQKKVIDKEKELIAIIEPVERELESKQKDIDTERSKIARKSVLPIRQEQLQKIEINVDDEFVLLMDDEQYKEFYNTKNAEYLEEKERLADEKRLEDEKKLQEEKDKIQRDKDKIAEEKRVIAAMKEAEAETKRLAEIEKQKAIDAIKQKAEDEKQKIIKDQADKEQARLQKEKEVQDAKEAEAETKKEAQAELEKAKKYQDFLKKNGYNEDTQGDYHISQEDNKTILYKKVDEITI